MHFTNNFEVTNRSSGGNLKASGFKIIHNTQDTLLTSYMTLGLDGIEKSVYLRRFPNIRLQYDIGRIDYFGDIRYMNDELYRFLMNTRHRIRPVDFGSFYSRASGETPFYDDLGYFKGGFDYAAHRRGDIPSTGIPLGFDNHPLLNFDRIFSDNDMVQYYLRFGSTSNDIENRQQEFADKRLISYFDQNQTVSTYFIFSNMIEWYVHIEVAPDYLESDLSVCTTNYNSLRGFAGSATLNSELNLRIKYNVYFDPQYTQSFTTFLSNVHNRDVHVSDPELYIHNFEESIGRPQIFDGSDAWEKATGSSLATMYFQIADAAKELTKQDHYQLRKQYLSQTFSIPFKINDVPNGFLRSMVSDLDETVHHDALNVEFYIKPIVRSYQNKQYNSSGEYNNFYHHNCIDVIARDLRGYKINFDLDWRYDTTSFNNKYANFKDWYQPLSLSPRMHPIRIVYDNETYDADSFGEIDKPNTLPVATSDMIHDLSTAEPDSDAYTTKTPDFKSNAEFRPLIPTLNIVCDDKTLKPGFQDYCQLYFLRILGIEFYPKKILLGAKDEPWTEWPMDSDYNITTNAPDSYHGYTFVLADESNASKILQSKTVKFHHNTFPIADQIVATKLYFRCLKLSRYQASHTFYLGHHPTSTLSRLGEDIQYRKYGLCLNVNNINTEWKVSVPELYDNTFRLKSDIEPRSNWYPILSIADGGLLGVRNIGRFVDKDWDLIRPLTCITDGSERWSVVFSDWFYNKPFLRKDSEGLTIRWREILDMERHHRPEYQTEYVQYNSSLDTLTLTPGYYLPAHPQDWKEGELKCRGYNSFTNSAICSRGLNVRRSDTDLRGWLPKYKGDEEYYTAEIGSSSITPPSPIEDSEEPVTNPNPGPITIDNPTPNPTEKISDFKYIYDLPNGTLETQFSIINLKVGTPYDVLNNRQAISDKSSIYFVADKTEKSVSFKINLSSFAAEYSQEILLTNVFTQQTRKLGVFNIPSPDNEDVLTGMPSPNPPLHIDTQTFFSNAQIFTIQQQLLQNELYRPYDVINNVVMTINNTETYVNSTIQNIGDSLYRVEFNAPLLPDTSYTVDFQIESSYGISDPSSDIDIITSSRSMPIPVFENSQTNSAIQKNLFSISATIPDGGEIYPKPIQSIQIQYKRLEDGIDEAFTDIGVGIVGADNLSYLNNLPTDLINVDVISSNESVITTNIFFPIGSFELRARFLSVDGVNGEWSDIASVIVKPPSTLSNNNSIAIRSDIDQINIIEPVFGLVEKCFNVLDVLPLTDDLICVLRNTANILQVWPIYLQILKQKPNSELDYESILNYSIEGYRPSFFNNFIKLTTEGFIIQLIDNNQEIKSLGINIPAAGSASITEDPDVSSIELPDISISTDRALPINKPDNGAYINNNYINSTNKGNFSVNNFFQNESNLIVEQPWQKWLDTGLGEDIIEGNVVFWDDNAFLIEDDDGIAPIDQQKLPQKPSVLNVRKIYASENTSYVGYDILEVVFQHNDLYNKRFIDYVIERYDNNTNQWVNQNIDSINIDLNDVNHKTTVRFRVLFRYGPSKYRVAARALDYFNQVVKGDYAEFSKLFTNLLTEDFDGN